MTVYNKYTQVSQPPDDYDQYGEGNFLVQAWGGIDGTPQSVASFDPWHISKDGGNTWYHLYPYKGWYKGRELMTIDAVANDNDKTLDYSSTVVFIDSITISYFATSTSGNRNLYIRWINQDDVSEAWSNLSLIGPSNYINICFSKGSSWSAVTPLTASSNAPCYSAPLPIAQPFHGSIRVYDSSDIDDNDDIVIQVWGWYAQPEFKEYEFRNCKNLCIGRTSNQTMYDGNGQLINVVPLLTKDDPDGVADSEIWRNY